MKTTTLKPFAVCLFSISLITAQLVAAETQSENLAQNDAVNTRPLSLEKTEQIEEQRKAETAQDEVVYKEEKLSLRAFCEEPFLLSSWFSGQSKYNAMETHHKRGMVLNGAAVELEDGSQWKLADPAIAASWDIHDLIVISPSRFWSREYNYYLTNTKTGTYVKANLFLGATKTDPFGQVNPYRHFVVNFEPVKRRVTLENGATWEICSDDFAIDDWAVNDAVIIGVNDSFYDSVFSSYGSILINVPINDHVRAKRIN